VLGLFVIASTMLGALAGALGSFYVGALPALSEIARNDARRLREVYYKLRLPADLGLLFLAGLLFSTGRLLVDLLYDPRYSAAGGMLEVLALSLFSSRYGLAVHAYLAVGRPQYATVLHVVGFVLLYSLLPALYYLGGIQGALWAIPLAGLAGLPFVFYLNAKLGLNDFRREIAVLVALPVGLLCGGALNLIAGWIFKQ
jgi:O-antigen/teichoic acid export membrane protein